MGKYKQLNGLVEKIVSHKFGRKLAQLSKNGEFSNNRLAFMRKV